jgi:hypothetical protein
MAEKKTQAKKATTTKNEPITFAFSKENYMLMFIGLAIIVIGFVLMAGKEDIFSTTKLTVAPLLVIAGFAFQIFAIMRKPKNP